MESYTNQIKIEFNEIDQNTKKNTQFEQIVFAGSFSRLLNNNYNNVANEKNNN